MGSFNNYGYNYNFGNGTQAFNKGELASVFGVLAVVYLFVLCIAGIIGIVMYFLQAAGIYKMGKRLGAPAPWLAFIPFANSFSFGKVAECPTSEKRPLPYGTVLLVLRILNSGVGLFFTAGFSGGLVTVIKYAIDVVRSGSADTSIFENYIETILPGLAIWALIQFIVALAYSVFRYIALWKIYNVFSHGNATVFLVLSILVPVSLPIIIFCLRNKPAFVYMPGSNGPTYMGGAPTANNVPGYNPQYPGFVPGTPGHIPTNAYGQPQYQTPGYMNNRSTDFTQNTDSAQTPGYVQNPVQQPAQPTSPETKTEDGNTQNK